MLGVIEGKEVDGEGAQSLQNIWLASESVITPREAESASPGIPNISELTLDASQTCDAVSIRFMASEEQIFNVHVDKWLCCQRNECIFHQQKSYGRSNGIV